MRRALLLALLLAAPALARAQATPTSGQVTFDNSQIGPDNCASVASAGQTVRMSWNVQLDSTQLPAGGKFRIYATNKAPTASHTDTGTGTVIGPRCATANDSSTSTFAAQIGSDIVNVGTQTTGIAESVSKRDLLAAAGQASCSASNPVYVCVHFHANDPNNAGAVLPTATGGATGTMTVSLDQAGSAHLDELRPGNEALNVYWSAGSNATKYKIRAVALLDPSTIPTNLFSGTPDPALLSSLDTAFHETGFVNGTGPFRMSGLVNDLTYAVAVVAYTPADAAAEPSNVLTGTPQLVNDFWQAYKAAGGQETGGCSSGLAGPVGLGALIAALALGRRRK